MSGERFSARWMTMSEQQRFLQDLQKPQFSELRAIIQDSQSTRGDVKGIRDKQFLQDFRDPMYAVGFCFGAGGFVQRSMTWGIYWNNARRFGIFSTKGRSLHSSPSSSIMKVRMEVWPWQSFFGFATTRGWAAGAGGVAADAFLIRRPPTLGSHDPSDEAVEPTPVLALKRVIGWGVAKGIGAGALPVEWFVELGYTESLWDNQSGWSTPSGNVEIIMQLPVPLIQKARREVQEHLQEVAQKETGNLTPGEALRAGVGKAQLIAQQHVKQIGHVAQKPLQNPPTFRPPGSGRS